MGCPCPFKSVDSKILELFAFYVTWDPSSVFIIKSPFILKPIGLCNTSPVSTPYSKVQDSPTPYSFVTKTHQMKQSLSPRSGAISIKPSESCYLIMIPFIMFLVSGNITHKLLILKPKCRNVGMLSVLQLYPIIKPNGYKSLRNSIQIGHWFAVVGTIPNALSTNKSPNVKVGRLNPNLGLPLDF